MYTFIYNTCTYIFTHMYTHTSPQPLYHASVSSKSTPANPCGISMAFSQIYTSRVVDTRVVDTQGSLWGSLGFVVHWAPYVYIYIYVYIGLIGLCGTFGSACIRPMYVVTIHWALWRIFVLRIHFANSCGFPWLFRRFTVLVLRIHRAPCGFWRIFYTGLPQILADFLHRAPTDFGGFSDRHICCGYTGLPVYMWRIF